MSNKEFSGIVEVYNETFYVNTATGEGVGAVIKKIEPLLIKKARKTHLVGYDFEDIKQELVLIAMDGIRNFDGNKGVKLSTFLHIHLSNKIISKIKNHNKLSNDASSLAGEANSYQGDTAKFRISRGEYNFSQVAGTKKSDNSETDLLFIDKVAAGDGMFSNNHMSDFDRLEFRMCLDKLTRKMDSSTRKIIELIYFNDYTVKDAAEAVGLTGWAASVRLRKLAEKRNVKMTFDQFIDDNE